MANATLRTPATQRLFLLGGLLRTTGGGSADAEGHLHFDRDARVWRSHDDRQVAAVHMSTAPAAAPFAECA